MTARPVTTTDLWKLVGLLLVLIDHWGLLFADDPSWRVVGRAAAPIFFFFIGLARTRRVPWSWVVLGLVLTAVESWTSGTGLGKINLNILINFAFVRLLLPEVERRVMPHPWAIALLAVAIVLLIRPFQQIMEYGAEGWLWALFGLSHRLALEAQHPHSRWTRDGFAAAAALVYTVKEILDHGFDGAEGAALAGLTAALTLALTLFRRADLSWQPPEPLAAVLRFCGHYSLEIYAATLLAMQITAYAIEDRNAEDDTEEYNTSFR
jgi:hypothetical protein